MEEEEDEEKTEQEPNLILLTVKLFIVLTVILEFLIMLSLTTSYFKNIGHEEDIPQLGDRLILLCVCLFVNFALSVLAYNI